MEIFPATRLDQQQSKYGPKRQVQQHCGGKCWWFVARACAPRRLNGGHASTVVPPRWSLIPFDTQHGRYPRDISPAAYCHLQPPKIPLASIVRVANVHRPTTAAAAAAAVPVVASAIRPRPAIGRCGIDWPSCPSSERATHTPTSVPSRFLRTFVFLFSFVSLFTS